MSTPTPMAGGGTPLYQMPVEDPGMKGSVPPQLEGLPDMKPEDMAFFGKLMQARCFCFAFVAGKRRSREELLCKGGWVDCGPLGGLVQGLGGGLAKGGEGWGGWGALGKLVQA
jgi:hypothetical protein